MAQTGFTPISLYYTTTASATPTAGNLVAGELAINTADGKLFYKDSSGVVQTIATKGGVNGTSSGQVLFNSSGAIGGSNNLFWDISNARLGIGTSTPGSPLAFADTTGLKIQLNGGGGNYYGISKLAGGGNLGDGEFRFTSGASTNGAFTFYSATTQSMIIDSSSNVGIGTATPSALGSSLTELTVKATTADKYANLNLIGVRDVGGNQNGLVNFWNNFGTLTRTSYIGGTNTASSNTSGELFFVTANAGTLAERMRINTLGTTSITTTDTNGLNVTSTNVFAGGNANFVILYMANMTSGTNGIALGKSSSTYNTSKIVFGYAGNGSSSNYVGLGFYDADNRLVIYPTGNASLTGTLTQNTSDDRLKTNFETISNPLDKVCSLRGFTHNWNDLAVKLNNSDPSIKELGVSAQEVQKVLPEAVCIAPFDQVKGNRFESESGENYLTVQYEKLVPLLIESIKELNAKVTALETQLGAK
jgi:hypothetical protein